MTVAKAPSASSVETYDFVAAAVYFAESFKNGRMISFYRQVVCPNHIEWKCTFYRGYQSERLHSHKDLSSFNVG
jgi:hypothetical protein